MIWVIAGIVIGLGYGIKLAYDEDFFALGPILALIGAAFGFLIALTIGGVSQANVPYEVEYNRPLATLQDGVGTRGSFLGFNPSGTYTFYEQTGELTYRMHLVRSSYATIIESENDSPHVVKETANGDMDAWRFRSGRDDKYTFYIPKGSIVMNFKLDAT